MSSAYASNLMFDSGVDLKMLFLCFGILNPFISFEFEMALIKGSMQSAKRTGDIESPCFTPLSIYCLK